MPDTACREIEGRAVGRGADLERSGDWIRQLGDEHRAEIDAALRQVKRDGRALFSFIKNEFPLPRTATLLAEIKWVRTHRRDAPSPQPSPPPSGGEGTLR